MNNGHLLVLSLIIAFSTLNESFGSPNRPQFLICTGLPKTFSRLNLPELGISFSTQSETQSSARSYLNMDVKAPRYAIIPDDIRTSPVKFSYTTTSLADSANHLVFSPPSPLIRLSALMSFCLHSSTYASS